MTTLEAQELKTQVHIKLKGEDQLKPEYYGELSPHAMLTCLYCDRSLIRARRLDNAFASMFPVKYHWLCEDCFRKLVVDIQKEPSPQVQDGLLECKVCHKRMEPSGFWTLKGLPWLFRCKDCYREYRKSLRRMHKDGYIPVPSLSLIRRIEKAFKTVKDWSKFDDHNDNPLTKRLGFTFIHHGLSRGVYKSKDGRYVLKTESCTTPWQNRNEIHNFDNFDSSQKKLFTRIFACDHEHHNWILAECAKTRDGGQLTDSKIQQLTHKVQDLMRKNNIAINDIHSGNVGYIGNRPVMVDYGFQDIVDGGLHD